MVRTTSVRLTLVAAVVWAAAGCGKDEAPQSGTPGQPSADRAPAQPQARTPAQPQARPPAPPAMPKEPAVYRIVLKSIWTAERHPLEYPNGAHFSGAIGASHNSRYRLFGVGRPATPALERLAEEGQQGPLESEIRAAITAGTALEMVKTRALRNFRDSLVATVRVDPAHPLVSFVAMIAPSPDWFTGAANVNLVENGAWVASRTLRLPAYDAGTDDGTTYRAANRDANPKKPIARAATRHFVTDRGPVLVATVRFIRQ